MKLPDNFTLGEGATFQGYEDGYHPFMRFKTRHEAKVGARTAIDGAYFNLGEAAHLEIGDDCRIWEAFFIAEAGIKVGHRVTIGWRATIVDADFHPVDPAERLKDAVACSTDPGDEKRRPFDSRPITIEDDVWIGPLSTILKGVRIGKGARVEPGAVVISDVPPGARVLGNPARVV
ncbi:MAG: acyltransferase [Elusimicrobia bacterium]|nr:acyltransferase [Elusimicrobiota bacterium]